MNQEKMTEDLELKILDKKSKSKKNRESVGNCETTKCIAKQLFCSFEQIEQSKFNRTDH